MLPHFSHIYLERSERDTVFTNAVLRRFPRAQVIEIDDYRNIFNRPGQNFALQKKSKKLILARKKDNFLYPINPKVQDFGKKNCYYNTLLLNCLYNCAYCYLQGMFSSANLVAFVNLDDFFNQTREAIEQRKVKEEPLHLAISYDTDLLASESILPYCAHWAQFCKEQENLKMSHYQDLLRS